MCGEVGVGGGKFLCMDHKPGRLLRADFLQSFKWFRHVNSAV